MMFHGACPSDYAQILETWGEPDEIVLVNTPNDYHILEFKDGARAHITNLDPSLPIPLPDCEEGKSA